MTRPSSECCVLGLKSSLQAMLLGLACTALGAAMASLCWSSLELEVAASPRLVESPRQVSAESSVVRTPQNHEHPSLHCDDCAFCRARAKKQAEQATASFVPIHKRRDYTVQPPDILSINATQAAGTANRDEQPIQGEYLVQYDGNVELGSWGKLHVAGKTVTEIKSSIEKLAEAANMACTVRVSVHTQNSRVYYIVRDGFGTGDTIHRNPYVGNETVLDAITSAGPLNEMGRHRIWISRPTPGSDTDAVIPIKWQWPSPTTVVVTNPALQPGDRVFISRPPSWVAFVEHAAKFNQARQAKNVLPAATVEKR